MTRTELQDFLEQFPADAPVAFADPSARVPGPDLDPASILTPEQIEQGVDEIPESYITPDGKICKASAFVLIRVPAVENPFAF